MADTRRWALAGYLSAEPPYKDQHPDMLLPLADRLLDYLNELAPLTSAQQRHELDVARTKFLDAQVEMLRSELARIRHEPFLDMATTEHLFRELIARFVADTCDDLAELVRRVRDECDHEQLAYRPVDD